MFLKICKLRVDNNPNRTHTHTHFHMFHKHTHRQTKRCIFFGTNENQRKSTATSTRSEGREKYFIPTLFFLNKKRKRFGWHQCHQGEQLLLWFKQNKRKKKYEKIFKKKKIMLYLKYLFFFSNVRYRWFAVHDCTIHNFNCTVQTHIWSNK